MKKKFSLTIVFISLVFIGLAQVPNAFNYQAVVRDGSGEVLANQSVSFRISVLQGSETGTVVYEETHAVTTNGFGLANLRIGDGTVVSGVFGPAGWTFASHFLKVEFDPAGGSAFTHLGTSEFVSVPYAFSAMYAEMDQVDDSDADPANELQTIDLVGSDLTLSDGGGTVTLPAGSSLWEELNNNLFYINGKVGVGKDPGADRRQFQSNTEDNQAVAALNNSGTYGAIYANNSGGGPAADFRSPVRILDGTQGLGKLLTSDAGGIASWEDPAWSLSSSDIYRLNGYVGIGMADPPSLLSLMGSANTSYQRFFYSTSGTTTSDGLLVGIASSSAYVWNYENTPLAFATNNVRRLHITADGNVGIGTNLPTHLLSVNGTAGKTGGGMWSVFSDRRLKDMHGEYDKGLSEIIALRPVKFNYKADNPLGLTMKVKKSVL